MENNEYSNLAEMQAQISLLKNKLEKESILNEKIIRNTISDKAHSIHMTEWLRYMCALFAITFGSLAFYFLKLPLYFIIGTALFMTACCVYNFIIHRQLHKTNYMSDDLSSSVSTIKRLKQNYIRWFMIGMPLGLIWFAWFVIEYTQVGPPSSIWGIIIYGSIGFVIGGIIGYRSHRKTIRACDEIYNCICQ